MVLDFNTSKDLQILISNLTNYSGYIRQKTLEQLKGCFDDVLFPHIVLRLSDYVPVNREIAAKHLLVWGQEDNFSKLCVDYFLDVFAAGKRIRVVPEIEQLIFNKLKENTEYFEMKLMGSQGPVPRALLQYAIQTKLISKEELVAISSQAKDQQVRDFWLSHLFAEQRIGELRNILKQNTYKDVQYKTLMFLSKNHLLNKEDLILGWNNQFLSIMDFAYFELKMLNFDFDHYFKQYPVDIYNSKGLKIRALQMILLKVDKIVFFEVLKKIEQSATQYFILNIALKLNYLDLDQYFDFVEKHNMVLPTFFYNKMNGLIGRVASLDEIMHCIQLSEAIEFDQLIRRETRFGFWDQLYWFFYLDTKNKDKTNFYLSLEELLKLSKYQKHSPVWSSERAQLIAQKLEHCLVDKKTTIPIDDINNILNLLKKRF